MIKNKKFIYILMLLIIIILLAILTYYLRKHIVMNVNNVSVCEEEFIMLLKDNKLQYEQSIRNEMKIPNELSVSKYFDNDKEKYYELLAEKNIEVCTKIKIQQALATEYKITDKFNYNKFKKMLKNENKDRLNKVKNNIHIYGVKNYSDIQYYTYVFDEMVNKLIDKLKNDKLQVTDEECLNYYKNSKIPLGVSNEKRLYTVCDISQIKDKLTTRDTASIQTQMSNSTNETINIIGENIKLYKLELNTSNLRNFIKSDIEAEQNVLSLKQGEVSEPFNSKGLQIIVRYEGFTKAKELTKQDNDFIKFILQMKKYEEMIDEEVLKSNVSFNKKNLTRLCKKTF